MGVGLGQGPLYPALSGLGGRGRGRQNHSYIALYVLYEESPHRTCYKTKFRRDQYVIFRTARKSASQTRSSRNMLEIFYTGAQGDGLTARARPGGQWFAPAERSRVNGVVTGVWSPPNAGPCRHAATLHFHEFFHPHRDFYNYE